MNSVTEIKFFIINHKNLHIYLKYIYSIIYYIFIQSFNPETWLCESLSKILCCCVSTLWKKIAFIPQHFLSIGFVIVVW